MNYFIDNCDKCAYPYSGILLYQCNNILGEKLGDLECKGFLLDTCIIGLLSKYNNQLIDKLGYEEYLNLIIDINDYFHGKSSEDWFIKKSWMSNKHRINILTKFKK